MKMNSIETIFKVNTKLSEIEELLLEYSICGEVDDDVCDKMLKFIREKLARLSKEREMKVNQLIIDPIVKKFRAQV